jgi:hypothetical protein
VTNRIINFILFVLGVPVFTMVVCSYAVAEGPFAGLEVEASHDKHKSILCYSGGFSRNLTYDTEFNLGYQSGDFYALVFYSKSECFSNGKKRDDDRAKHVRSRIEEMGVRVGVRFDLF